MRTRRRAAFLENVLCLVLLAIIPLIAAWPYISGNKAPVSVDELRQLPPWESAWQDEAAPEAHSAVWADQRRHLPALRFLNSSMLATGSFPLWNPLEACGVPFLALWRTRVLSPFSLPFYYMPWREALCASFLLKLLIAGWCAYYAGRRFGLPPAMALLLGVAWQLSGPVFLYFGSPISDTLPWLPLLVVSAERLLLGQWRAWPLVAFVLALMALGGEPEALAASILFIVIYFLMRQWRDRRRVYGLSAFSGLLLAMLGGAALIAVQLVPYFEYLLQSVPPISASMSRLYLDDLLALITPTLSDFSRQESLPLIFLLYPGVAQTLLLALWFALRKFAGRDLRRRMESMFWASGLFVLGGFLSAAYGDRMALLGLLKPQHFFLFHAFTLAFMTAAAAEVWNELDPEECKTTLTHLAVLIPLGWGVVFALLIWAGLRDDGGKGAMLLNAPGRFYPPWGVGFALLVLLGSTLLRPSMRIFGYGLSLTTILSFIWVWSYLMPATPADFVYPQTDFIQALQKAKGENRVTGSEQLAAWPLAGNDIPQTYAACGARYYRYADFMERAKSDPLLLRRTGCRTLLLTKADMQGPFAPVRPVLHIRSVFETGAILFDDTGAEPRARMIHCGRSVNEYRPADLDSNAPPLLEGMPLPAEDSGKGAVVSIEEESPNRVVLNVAKTRPGVLVLADTFYPGWKAKVDNTPTSVHAVDSLFRGIEVGEGAHVVVFEFAPISLRIGGYISFAALLVLLFNLRHVIHRKHRSPYQMR